ncbi:MAG: hypothetical protein R6V01_10575 [Thermoplasmatota archaeon]
MKIKPKAVFISLFLMLCNLALGGVVLGATDVIEYTDAEGDTEEGGLENYAIWDEADITSLSADVSGDPLILSLTTLGGIYYGSEYMDHNYYFYLDLTGDDSVDATVTITRENKYISGDPVVGSNSPLDQVSGDDSSTLEVRVPLDLFTNPPTVDDAWAMSEVKDGNDWVRDYVNRDFQGEFEEPIEITPPSNDVDPKSEDPTNDSLGVTIDNFDMEFSSQGTTYDYQITATGSGSDDIIQMYYCIWSYSEGHGSSYESWEESPIDEEHSYGDHYYNEEFMGTGPGGSFSSWEWTFHSSGPLDDSNRDRYEDPESYWQGLDSLVLYIRGYDAEGEWDQDSEDITEEYTGISSGSSDDDDTSGDDDSSDDDDTSGDDDDEDSPGPGTALIAGSIMTAIVALFILGPRRRR